MGNSSPRLPESGESMSQPRPRRIGWSGGLCGSVNFSTVSGLNTRTPSSSPPFSIIWAKRARSSAVENSPAWPATPPM